MSYNYRKPIDNSEISSKLFESKTGFDYFWMANALPSGNNSRIAGGGIEERSVENNNGGKRYNKL